MLETGVEQPHRHLLFFWAVLRYGKMLLVMQSSRTLREAMTKKGRCSVFRQRPFDVSATTGCCRGCLHCCVGFRSGSVIPEVCGKFRLPQAHRPFRAEKPQLEALQHSGVLGKFLICRILTVFAFAAGRVHLYPWLDNGHNSQFRLHTKTPAGAKLLLPALACLLVLFSVRAVARFGPLRLRGLHA